MTTRPQARACSSGRPRSLGHDHALARGQPVRLHHVRRAELVQRGADLGLGPRRSGRGGGRDPGGGHDLLGERLRALDHRGRPGRARSRRRPGRPDRVGRRRPPAAPRGRRPPGRRRSAWPARRRRPGRWASTVVQSRRARRCPGCPARRAGSVTSGSRGQGPGQGVLAAAGAEDEDAHAVSLRAPGLRSGARSCRVWSRRGPTPIAAERGADHVLERADVGLGVGAAGPRSSLAARDVLPPAVQVLVDRPGVVEVGLGHRDLARA